MGRKTSAAKKRAKGAGRPATDIAWRLRNWVWYCQIKKAIPLSDEALDAKYLVWEPHSVTRRRLFQRIRSVGSEPDSGEDDNSDESIFQRVHAESTPLLDGAKDNFNSLLWKMLAKPGYAQREHANIIDGIVAARGWYRASAEDIAVGKYFIEDDPAFGWHSDHVNVYSSMLTSLESEPGAVNLALLGALFHEAMSVVDLETAAALRDSLLACGTLWMANIGWWDTNDPLLENMDRHWLLHGAVFEHLLERRIVRGDWTKPQIDPRVHRNQRQYVQALLQANARPQSNAGSGPSLRPIVLPSPRIRWLQENRTTLSKVRKELAWADDQAQFCTSDDPKLRKYGRECLQYGTKLREQIRPPKRDTRYCLPVLPNRGPRYAHRALPYLTDGTQDESGLLNARAPTIGKKSDRGKACLARDDSDEPFEC